MRPRQGSDGSAVPAAGADDSGNDLASVAEPARQAYFSRKRRSDLTAGDDGKRIRHDQP